MIFDLLILLTHKAGESGKTEASPIAVKAIGEALAVSSDFHRIIQSALQGQILELSQVSESKTGSVPQAG